MNIELLVTTDDQTKIFQPAVEEAIEWTTQRRGAPGRLTFGLIKDDIISIPEGSAVRFRVDGKNVFFGFVFTKKQDKDRIITATAYDQLRYLQNKDTYVYENKTASQLVKMIAQDFSLNMGTVEDTGFVIASRVEENTSLFDMIENALDLTLQNSQKMYVLYDDFGRLTLQNISSMVVGNSNAYLMIDEETGENFEYTSSIDTNTYNKIKLTYDNEETGKREVYIARDSANINKWGVLQYYDILAKGENGKAKADALLSLYNRKTRSLRIVNAIGDLRVRAGSMVVVNLALGDVNVRNLMLVEQVKHTFYLDSHFMNLSLRGGDFVA